MNNEVVSRAEAYLEYAQKIRNDYPEPVARMDYHLLSVAELVRLGGADVQTIKDAVNDYLTLNPPQTMTDSQIATSVNKSLSDGSINVGGITDNTLDTTDKTYVGAINEVNTNSTHTNRTVLDNLTDKDGSLQYKGKDITGGSGTTDYVDLTNKPSINGVELSGDKSLSDLGITNYDDTQVKQDISDLKTDKQDKTDNSLDTTDKTVIGAINEIYGTQLDTVGFSADYKNIILNRKNGLNPYTIHIASIIHNAKLIELNDVDATDIGNGKTIVYDATTQKHKYVDSAGTDELVKMDASTDAKYLSDLIDKSTVVNDNGVLKVKKLDGQEVTIAEINYLKGLTMNVMDLVDLFANGGVKVLDMPFNTYADLLAFDRTSLLDDISYIVYVLTDETHADAKTTYLIDKTNTTFFGNADNQRNFTTNPIDLATEVTGKLDNSHIDVDNLWSLLTINDTYKTLTTNNEVFGTHGAKALYDELVTAIGNKANTSDLESHTGDTDIHVSTTDKEKWDKVTEKANKTDFDTHTGDTDIHITADERTAWNKVTDKIDKTSISTTIDSTSTDEQVASAKAVYDNIKYKYLPTLHNIDVLDYIVNNINKEGFYIFYAADDCTNTPRGNWTRMFVDYLSKTRIIVTGVDIRSVNNTYEYKNTMIDKWSGWKKVCTTSVADVGVTDISMSSTYTSNANCKYQVVNGICYVDFMSGTYKLTTNVNGVLLASGLPIPKTGQTCTTYVPWSCADASKQVIVFVNGNGELILHASVNANATPMFCSFSYPVKES